MIGLIVSVAVQLWIFLGSQIYRKQMRSFALPTRIDGCIAMRGNISLPFNMTMFSNFLNETLTTTGIAETVVKYVKVVSER